MSGGTLKLRRHPVTWHPHATASAVGGGSQGRPGVAQSATGPRRERDAGRPPNAVVPRHAADGNDRNADGNDCVRQQHSTASTVPLWADRVNLPRFALIF